MFKNARVGSSGALTLQPMYADPFRGRSAHHLVSILQLALPRPGLSAEVNVWRLKNFPNVLRGLWRVWVAETFGIATHYGALFLRKRDGSGRWTEYGIASLRVVTTAGVTYLCADIAGGANDSNLFKFHGFGTGTTAEASSDTALVTELTTEYNPNGTRPTGSQSASTNTYTTIATLTPDSGTPVLREHGIFTATSAGTMLDRSVYAAVTLDSSAGDSVQATYVLTLTAGG